MLVTPQYGGHNKVRLRTSQSVGQSSVRLSGVQDTAELHNRQAGHNRVRLCSSQPSADEEPWTFLTLDFIDIERKPWTQRQGDGNPGLKSVKGKETLDSKVSRGRKHWTYLARHHPLAVPHGVVFVQLYSTS